MFSYSVRIWTVLPELWFTIQPVSTITEDAWNEVVLNTPYSIPSGKQFGLVSVVIQQVDSLLVVIVDLKLRATEI
jgi:hypothetical protein